MGFSQHVRDELSDWIDSDVIAEEILEDLEESGVEPTLESAKAVWLNVLETELYGAVRHSITTQFGV